jgi:predicted DCC family thiol-disulfide oxidoreductase YuxK
MTPSGPILLFNDECGVCRRIARWVQKSGQGKSGETSIVERPIGDDPEALRSLNPDLDIWDAYATIHLLMPDGSMKVGGEAVAEVLRTLPGTKWFARSFAISLFGFRPFQSMLNVAYTVLADVRPLFGCESCGKPGFWLRPIGWIMRRAKTMFGAGHHQAPTPHFARLKATPGRPPIGSGARPPETVGLAARQPPPVA